MDHTNLSLERELDASQPAVVNAAASTVLDLELRDLLRAGAFVIWLKAAPATLTRRTTGSPARPRVASDQLTLAEHQRAERDPLFAEVADLLVATDGTTQTALDDVVANLPADVVPRAERA